MPDLTEDELHALDMERARSAHAETRMASGEFDTLPWYVRQGFIAAARLGRIGGNTRPVDPGVLVVRRLLGACSTVAADGPTARGELDNSPDFQAILAELRTICAEKGWEL